MQNSPKSSAIFSKKVLQKTNGGAVYGCILNNEFGAFHIKAVDKDCRDKMRGSKYVQSQMGECYKEIKEDLNDDVKVLFSGTSCQVAGLRSFLQKDYDNLLCIDIVCHGVPSPKIWQNYLKWLSKKKMIKAVDFRNKTKFGWADHVETIYFDKNQKDSQVWTYIFYSHNALRPSCYECPYKSIHHPGDITIADYWGIDKAAPGFDDNKGVSLVLVNTEKGEKAFEDAKADIEWKETRIEDSMQHPLIEPEKRPETRDQFWEDFNNKEFSFIAKKYGGLTPRWRKAARKAKRFIKKLLGK